MSCVFCSDKNAALMASERIPSAFLNWCPDTVFTGKDILDTEVDFTVFIDSRGYLRMCDTDDSQCLDHGQKIAIKFCPMCGGSFNPHPTG